MDIQLSDEVSQAYLSEVEISSVIRSFYHVASMSIISGQLVFMHSINVSYISWKLARKFGCDEKVAARAGLLHDFCPYDFHKKTPTGEHQAFYHPKAAAENSERIFEINEKERDAILSHMFPLGPIPKNREAWIITMADKICATLEGCHIAIALARRNRVVVISASM